MWGLTYVMGTLLTARLTIRWQQPALSYEGSTRMQDEEMKQMQEQEQRTEPEAPPETATEETEKEPEKEHDAVSPGGECSVCGWKFGDERAHIVSFGALRNEPEPVVEPPKVAVKASDPKACEPVSINGGKCPKCGWSADDPETRGNAHPVLL